MNYLLCLLAAALTALSAGAQVQPVEITTAKTTSLVFPAPVRHVDRGSRDVLVQAVSGAEHVLLLRAARRGFEETNLSVVTTDGAVYALPVCYGDSPSRWIYHVPSAGGPSLERIAERLRDNPATLYGISDAAAGVRLRLLGLYAGDAALFVQLELENHFPLVFHPGALRCFVGDRQRGRRTPLQERDLTPICTAGDTAALPAGERRRVVVVLPRFSPAPGQFLALELVEPAGGRQLRVKIKARRLLQALPLPHP